VRLQDVLVTTSASLGVVTLGRPERLSGIVREPSGAPAADVLLTATQEDATGDTWSGRTDPDGRFSLAVPGGTYVLAAQPADGVGARTATAATTGLAIDLTLDDGAWVTGTVRLDGTAAGWSLLHFRDGTGENLLGIATADADGTFALRLPLGAPTQ
jgi:hypothetical protein